MAWKFLSGVALNIQISDKLRSDILKGAYKRGDSFPTVRQLAYEAGVNPNTMQKALAVLEDEGLIIAKSTVGRIVTDEPSILTAARKKATEAFISEISKKAKSMSISKDELIKYIEEGWTCYE